MGKKKPVSKKSRAKARAITKPHRKSAARAAAKKPTRKSAVAKKPAKSAKKSHTPTKNKKTTKPAPAAAPHASAKAKPKAPAKTPPPPKGRPKAADSTGSVGATDASAPAIRLSPDQLRKQLMAKARSRTKTQRAAAFTLDDVRGEIARTTTSPRTESKRAAKEESAPKPAAAAHAPAAPKKAVEPKPEQRRLGAASLADILGYNPAKDERPVDEESQIDAKYLKYYKLLVQLRDHVKSGLALHAEDTLKRSSREDSGDLSGYGQHMADAGTDNFDRDFALSLVSNEQEALYEIEEAINRIKNGTYGIDELTGKPIAKERLLAVPFARYSVESQAEVEKNRRRSSQRGGLFSDAAGEEGARIMEEDSE